MAHLEPPAVAAPDAAPAGPVAAAVITTYRQLFSDATRDAVFGNPGAYLAGYRFTDQAGAVPIPATLRDQTSQLCDHQPMAFLCLIARHDGAANEVRILHRFMRYLELPGERATGFHDRVLELMGDIRPHQYPAVEVPVSILHLATTQVRVPTAAAMDGLLLATWPVDVPALGPYLEDGDIATELVRPRNIQLFPSRYAVLLVDRDGESSRQAYVEIAGAIRGDDNDVPCADVLTWLRAACTCRGGEGAQSMTPIVVQSVPPVHLPAAVHDYVCGKIASDFPATLRGGPAGVDPAIVAVVRALSARSTLTGGPREPKTAVKEAYRETYPVLLRYSRVDQAEDVAPLRDRLANAHKSEHQTILQQEFARVCNTKGLATELYCPVVTTSLKQLVVGFGFAGVGPDDLATGLNPFQVTYAGAQDYYTAQAAASVAQQLA